MSNKIALVTGGSRGLGRDMALQLADGGKDVIITYHSNKEEADKVVAEIKGKGQNAVALRLDTSDTKQFAGFFSEVAKALQNEFGVSKFDYIVNNAGFGLYKNFDETSEDEFDSIINVHFKGPYFLTQQALPLMNSGGGIVNISSGLARFSFPGSSAYGATKAAVESLSRYQAKELGERGIRANTVAPGAIETDFGGGRVRDNADMNKQLAGMTALGRVGLPDDIGGIVAFLCSDQAKWVNGQRIEASGGFFL